MTTLFAAATFLGAFLLFLVQPLIAKYILPWFGGGAAVWTTCMLFFQTVLLAGYLYAHLGASRLNSRAQSAVHVLLLIAAAASALPAIIPSAHWQPAAEAAGSNPTPRILLLLAATVGLPCVALAATSPLLHAWYARLRPGASVYRLYALSNAGSLLALLAYPLVVERFLSRRAQAVGWTAGMCLFAALCAACAVLAARHAARGLARHNANEEITATPRAAVRRTHLALWVALPACAAALLLGTTNTITQEVAPVPLLWVLPLALYLLTFIVAFDHPRWYRRPVWAWLLVVTVGSAVLLLSRSGDVDSIALIVGGLSATLFVGCMVLHGELARLKPPPERLTAYYLAIAAGGALGGLLVAVGAPLLLRSYAELPIALWACCFLAFLAVHVGERRFPTGLTGMLGITGITALAAFLSAAAHRAEPGASQLARSRDFYSVLSVWAEEDEDAGTRSAVLRHGAILHGHQYLDPPALRAQPTTYFHPDAGVGRVLGQAPPRPRPRRVGVVGLGTGTLAAYAAAGDVYRFYEISPSVLRLAREYFTYLADATQRGATVDVILGDGRLSLEREPADRLFDTLVLDAFSGDAIPVHLLTSEAFDLYRRRLAPGGMLCVHVSNKHVDLAPVVAAAARRLGWRAVLVESEDDDEDMSFAADWILLGPDPARVDAVAGGVPTLDDHAPGFPAWTDERAAVLRVIR